MPLIFSDGGALQSVCLLGLFASFAGDYAMRQKLASINLSFGYFNQLAVPHREDLMRICSWAGHTETSGRWILPRVLELTYTAWDLKRFAQDCGWTGPLFRWDEERRFLLRCELDAAFFHLYLPAEANGGWCRAEEETADDLARLKASFPIPRDAVAYIMDTFPIVKRKDEERWGDYRTKRVILEICDAMAESIRTGQPYKTRLDPPPADPRVAHGSRAPEERTAPVLVRAERIGGLDELRVLRRVTPRRNERYMTCVPRLDLKVAASGFSDGQLPNFEEWVEVNASQPLRKGMFIAQVVGRSMEPLIPDGAYCLFQFKAPQVRRDLVGLFQLHSAEDPELGGRFTVKRLKLSTQVDEGEGWRRVVTLFPENPAYEPIVVGDDDVKFVAEFLEVLRPLVGDATEGWKEAISMNVSIDYESDGFACGGPVSNGHAVLDTSWDELLWAAVTVGRPNRQYVFRHGDASKYEAMFRWSITRMALEQRGPSARRLRRTDAAKTLDPSEKGAVNYFLGMTLCKLFAYRLLHAPWVMHLDVFRPLLNPVLSGRSRPDLVGQTRSNNWVALESKGRVSPPNADAKNKAKQQAQRLISVNGMCPTLRIGGITYFRNDVLQFFWRDPESEPQKRRNAIEITFDDRIWRYYYLPVSEIIRSRPQYFERMLREPLLMPVDGLDLDVGIHPLVLGLLAKEHWGETKRSCLDFSEELHQANYQADGIRVVAGCTWLSPFTEFDKPPEPFMLT